jgi:Cytochrome P450
MVCYPEVQRKAQEELENVIGPHRLPQFGDRENLPYIELICKEVYRWQPVVPMGVAHAVTQHDIYKDYFIPKGTLVIGNIWLNISLSVAKMVLTSCPPLGICSMTRRRMAQTLTNSYLSVSSCRV